MGTWEEEQTEVEDYELSLDILYLRWLVARPSVATRLVDMEPRGDVHAGSVDLRPRQHGDRGLEGCSKKRQSVGF